MSAGLNLFCEDYRNPTAEDCFLRTCQLTQPKEVTLCLAAGLSIADAAVALRGGKAPVRCATLGLAFGQYGFSVGLNAGIEGPVGGTIWNLFTISIAFRTFKVKGLKDG